MTSSPGDAERAGQGDIEPPATAVPAVRLRDAEPAGQGDVEPLVVNIRGERVALRPIRRDQIPLYHRWANDVGYTRTTAGPTTSGTRAPPRRQG